MQNHHDFSLAGARIMAAARGAAGRLKDRLKRFRKDRAGAVAIIFGLALIPIMLAAGAAIDYSRALVVKNRLGQALDAAALAVGASSETDNDVLKKIAEDYFKANYPAAELGVPGELVFAATDKTVSLSANAKLSTAVMGIAGYQDLNIGASVKVVKELRRLEVVMVLDNTGSMNSSGKLSALKTAAKQLVNTLAAEQPNEDMLKFALVPFAATVNVGTQYLNSGWIDTAGANSLHGSQFQSSNNVFTIFNKLQNKSWNGCVEARPAPHDTQDTAPTAADGDTLWVPYYAPDEPDNQAAWNQGYNSYPNNFLDDETNTSSLTVRQRRVNKYNNEWVSGDGPHFNCRTATITPLTGNKNQIISSIDAMIGAGSTVVPIGLAWGWRVVSPGEPFTQGRAYTDPDTNKAIILLTDGKNDIGNLNNHNKSFYSGYGHIAQGRLGTTNSSQAHAELDARVTTLCNNIKANGIIIYTITFKLNNATTQQVFRNCASDTSKYFNSPSNSQLQETFNAIAKDLGSLRISR